LALDEGDLSTLHHGRFTPGTHYIPIWPGESQFSSGGHRQEKYNLPLPEFESRSWGIHPMAQSLYKLLCPGSHSTSNMTEK